MPSAQKKKVLEKTRKRESRGRLYLAAIVLIAIAVGVGWFAYSFATAGRPDFIIGAPPGVAVLAGTPTTSKINVTALNQFNGVVDLAATASTGLTVSITPASITGSGVATLTASSATNGTYTVTVTGTSGSLTHTVNMVTAPLLATLSTTDGTIVVQLFPASAPKTVANIVSLAKSGFYTDLVWHRIVRTSPGVIQTGDPNTRGGNTDRSTWGTGGSSQTVPLEIDSSLHNDRGYLGMARSSDPNSGSSQFYVNMANNEYLDGQYTVFGRVLSGMSAADALWNTPTNSQDQPISPVFLLSVTISGS
jgi:cyclophilin family peptidyl-prolyl cis-trans isomerase